MIHLMFCLNTKVYDGLFIGALSAARVCKEPITVHVLTMDLTHLNKDYTPITETQTKFLEEALREYNKENKVILYDASEEFKKAMNGSKNLETRYTPYTLLRLVIDKIPSLPDKLLYLDTDIIVKEDLSELYHTNMDGHEIAGASDYLGRFFRAHISVPYLNAGVLLLNLPLIRESKLFEKCIYLLDHKKYMLPDQDVLNKLAKSKLKLPSKYNNQRNPKKDTVINHFCMRVKLGFFKLIKVNIKPWEVKRIHSTYKVHDYDDLLSEYQQYKKIYGGKI